MFALGGDRMRLVDTLLSGCADTLVKGKVTDWIEVVISIHFITQSV